VLNKDQHFPMFFSLSVWVGPLVMWKTWSPRHQNYTFWSSRLNTDPRSLKASREGRCKHGVDTNSSEIKPICALVLCPKQHLISNI